MLPFMNGSHTFMLNIPELSGGMNLRDGISLVGDEQLTDCKNMWYMDGSLRTRPRISANANADNETFIKSQNGDVSPEVCICNDIKYIEDGEVYYLEVIKAKLLQNGKLLTALYFLLINENEPYKLYRIGEHGVESDNSVSHFVFKHLNDVYCFYSDGGKKRGILKFSSGDKLSGKWTKDEITENDIEAPLVATDGLPSTDCIFNGTILKGYNILSPYYTMEVSTVDPSKESNEMRYPILFSISKRDKDDEKWSGMLGRYVKVVYTDINGNTHEHKVTIQSYGGGDEDVGGSDGYQLSVWRNEVRLLEPDPSKKVISITKGQYVRNNMKITAPVPNYEENVAKLFNMTRSVRYGGQGTGDGGSRLFLTGNTKEDEKSLVMWSALDNPLYFPQNAFVYVGDEGQAVTAFGKMSGGLVVFKENEVHLMEYTKGNTSVDDGDIPTVLINDNIGCDCPNTVQLCRNRLVWADSRGKVYSLVSQNQYNERTIFEVSKMIARRLKTQPNLKNAHSADYMGHYILQVDNRMYVMDYNSYGYNYVSSYSKTEDANAKIPWYYWELCVSPLAMAVANERLIMPDIETVGPDSEGYHHYFYNTFCMDGLNGDDESVERKYEDGTLVRKVVECPITSFVQTKLFDFGQPAKCKSVTGVWFSFGYNGGWPIKVEFISEKQIPDEHTVTVEGAEAEKYSPEYVHSCRLFPHTNGTVMFGARISCEGEMAIDSMTLRYRQLGMAR